MFRRVFALVALMSVSQISDCVLIGGRHTQIDYNDCGLWNDRSTRRGFTMEDCCPVETTFPGSPWQLLVVSYYAHGVYYEFKGNAANGFNACNYKVLETTVLDDGTGTVGIRHKFDMKHIILTKEETWDFRGRTVVVEFKAEYPNDRCTCRNIERLRVVHAVDPDQDRNPFYTFSTINDVIYPGGASLKHYAEAVGPVSCNTMAYGICSQQHGNFDFAEQVGFSYWDSSPNAFLFDPNGSYGDLTLHYRHIRNSLKCDKSASFRFVVTWGANAEEARKNYQGAYKKLCRCSFIPFPSYRYTPRPCKNICPCDCDEDRCACNNKIKKSNFKFPTIYAWLKYYTRHIRGRDIGFTVAPTDFPDTPAPDTPPLPTVPAVVTDTELGLAGLASAADRFSKLGGMPTFELDEELSFVRILDDLPVVCPHLGATSKKFLSAVNTTNIREVYDEYTAKCK